MSKDANDFLMSGGLPAPKLKEIGDRFDGTVVAVNTPFQQRDMADNTPLFWNNDPESPIMVVPIEVKSDSDGESYGLYVRASSNLQSALAKAVRESGARGVEPGAHISVAVIGKEPAQKKGFSDKKLHGVAYTPPQKAAANNMLMGAGTPNQVPVTTPPVSDMVTSQDQAPPVSDMVTSQDQGVPAPDFVPQPQAQPQQQPAGQALPPGFDQMPPHVQELMRQYMQGGQQ